MGAGWRIGALIDLGLASGLRHAELRGLAWGAGGLDVEARMVTVACQRADDGELVPPKGGCTRVVPIRAKVATRMREHRMACGRPDDGAPVFPFDLRPPWERVRAAAGLADLSRSFTRCATPPPPGGSPPASPCMR